MFQLTYRLETIEDLIEQLSQRGAQFLSKGPAQETSFHLEGKELRLEQGVNADLILVTKYDHYQEILDVGIQQYPQLNDLLNQALGIKEIRFKQVHRYHFKQILVELHIYNEQNEQILYLQGEDLGQLKQLARQLALSDLHRIA